MPAGGSWWEELGEHSLNSPLPSSHRNKSQDIQNQAAAFYNASGEMTKEVWNDVSCDSSATKQSHG